MFVVPFALGAQGAVPEIVSPNGQSRVQHQCNQTNVLYFELQILFRALPSMHRLLAIAIALFIHSVGALAQSAPATPEQEKVGLRILDALIHERGTEAWSMLTPETQKAAPKDWLARFMRQLQKMKAAGGFSPEFSQFAVRVKLDNSGQPYGVIRTYTVKANTSYPPRFTISIFFDTESSSVSGMDLNDMMPPPSSYRPSRVRFHMERDLSGQEGWFVGGDSVAIDGVTLIPLSNNKVVMAIKVIRDMSAVSDVEHQAHIIGIPIARYAVDHGYRQKADDVMLGLDMELNENIDVAFVIPGTDQMHVVHITPSEYRGK